MLTQETSKSSLQGAPYLFAHDICGLHDVPRGQPVAASQNDRLLQGDAQSAAAMEDGSQ